MSVLVKFFLTGHFFGQNNYQTTFDEKIFKQGIKENIVSQFDTKIAEGLNVKIKNCFSTSNSSKSECNFNLEE